MENKENIYYQRSVQIQAQKEEIGPTWSQKVVQNAECSKSKFDSLKVS